MLTDANRIPDADYRADPALNWSTLKLLRTSAALYRAHVDGDLENKETPARRFGRLVHAMVLEPGEVAGRYAVWEGGRRGTKEHKAWLADVPRGHEEVTASEYDHAEAIARAVRSHPVAAAILDDGEAEVTVTWYEQDRAMKARLDWLVPAAGPELAALLGIAPGTPVVADLKTCGDVSARGMARYVADGLYHGQMAHYAAAVEHLSGRRPACVIIGAETAAPHDVGVYLLADDGPLWCGDLLRDGLLLMLSACEASNTWPGKVPELAALELPRWAAGWEHAPDTDDYDVSDFAAT